MQVMYEDYIQRSKGIPFEVAKIISESYPLRGKEAANALREQFSNMGNQAADDGLSESDVMRLARSEAKDFNRRSASLGLSARGNDASHQ
jgi:hypothetical protein